MVAGHDEYWSSAMRDGFDAALAAGTNLAFMGSNDAYWNVRYADDNRTILSAKSLYDPNPVLREKTAMFREIGRPECMIMGVQHNFSGPLAQSLDYVVTADRGGRSLVRRHRAHRAATRSSASSAASTTCSTRFPTPASTRGSPCCSTTTAAAVDQNGDAVRFTAPSGARVFASGAQQFSWALDDWRSDGSLFPAPPVEPWRGRARSIRGCSSSCATRSTT